MSESLFPSKADDAFNASTTSNESVDPSAWLPESHSTVAPRWHLLTDQERDEQNKVINKLESKLKGLARKKDKPTQNYTNEIIPDPAHSFHLSDSEGDDDNRGIEEDAEEGLPLLWNKHVDGAPRKSENQYHKWWFACFPCCH